MIERGSIIVTEQNPRGKEMLVVLFDAVPQTLSLFQTKICNFPVSIFRPGLISSSIELKPILRLSDQNG